MTVVKEYVSDRFVSAVLPLLEANDLPGVTCWMGYDKNVDQQQSASAAMDNSTLRLHVST